MTEFPVKMFSYYCFNSAVLSVLFVHAPSNGICGSRPTLELSR